MGCSNGHPVTSPNAPFDSRVPFSLAEIEDIQAFWEFVKRKFEDTAMENLTSFFRMYPHFLVLFPSLREIPGEEVQHSAEFEVVATSVFAVYDDVIEYLKKDVDHVLAKLEEVAAMHAKIEGFQSEFFQYMEDPFIDAFREKVRERFHDHEEHLMRRLFKWINQILVLEVETMEYHMVEGE